MVVARAVTHRGDVDTKLSTRIENRAADRHLDMTPIYFK
jgi:hypothetical protein